MDAPETRVTPGGFKWKLERSWSYAKFVQFFINVATLLFVSTQPWWQLALAGAILTGMAILLGRLDSKKLYEEEMREQMKPFFKIMREEMHTILQQEGLIKNGMAMDAAIGVGSRISTGGDNYNSGNSERG